MENIRVSKKTYGAFCDVQINSGNVKKILAYCVDKVLISARNKKRVNWAHGNLQIP
jgi:hypothetical protein